MQGRKAGSSARRAVDQIYRQALQPSTCGGFVKCPPFDSCALPHLRTAPQALAAAGGLRAPHASACSRVKVSPAPGTGGAGMRSLSAGRAAATRSGSDHGASAMRFRGGEDLRCRGVTSAGTAGAHQRERLPACSAASRAICSAQQRRAAHLLLHGRAGSRAELAYHDR